MPALRYPAAATRSTADAPQRPAPGPASSAGDADSSISFWLRRWIEQSRTPTRPGGAVVVGDDLHLDVARAGHEPLHQHARVAERPPGLVARPLEGRQQLGLRRRRIRIPRPPPPAAALIMSGKPIAAAWRSASAIGLDRAAAPLGDRDPDLLARAAWRAILSPRRRIDVGGRADEGRRRSARTARRTRGPRRRTPTRPRPRRRGTRAAPARARRGRCRGCRRRRARSRPPRPPRARRSPAAPPRCGGRSCGSAQPRSWLSSWAAWISRRAGSPRLTMAIRLSIAAGRYAAARSATGASRT